MSQANDQMVAFNATVLEMTNRFTNIVLRGVGEMVRLQTQVVQSALAEGAQQAQVLAGVKDMQDLERLRTKLAQPNLEHATAHLKTVCQVAAATQVEINQLVAEMLGEFNKRFTAGVNPSAMLAPGGADVATAAFNSAISSFSSIYDNMLKTTKQFSDMAQANLQAAASGAKRPGNDKQS